MVVSRRGGAISTREPGRRQICEGRSDYGEGGGQAIRQWICEGGGGVSGKLAAGKDDGRSAREAER